MTQPTVSDVRVNSLLTNMSVAYRQANDNYAYAKFFPSIPVDGETGLYASYDKNDWLRDEAKLRAAGAPAIEVGFNVTTSNSYSCARYDAKKLIPDRIRNNASSPLDMDRDVSEHLMQVLAIRMERAWAASFFANSVWGTSISKTGSDRWNDSGSDPISQINTAVETILSATGFVPNMLGLGFPTYQALKDHPLIVDRYKHTSAEAITPQLVGKVLGFDNVIVSKSIYATNNEGGTAAYAHCAGKHALVAYVEPVPGIMKASAGYCFVDKNFGGNDMGIRIKKYRVEEREGDMIEAAVSADFKKTATDLGYFFNSVVD